MAEPKVNIYKAICYLCDKKVEPGDGYVTRDGGFWKTRHKTSLDCDAADESDSHSRFTRR